MTIKKISKVSSIILAVIIIGFAVSVVWSLNHLSRTFASVEFFAQEKDKIFTEVSQPILNYLLTGEVTMLGQIEQSLNGITSDVSTRTDLSVSLQAPFVALIGDLQQKTMPELAAAGKLADPQELLINNERMVAKYLQTLRAYTEMAKNAPQPKKQTYAQLIGDAQTELINLTMARQNFFTYHQKVSIDSVTRHWELLSATANKIKDIPLLGVMKDIAVEDDVFSLGEKKTAIQTEDMAIEPLREIPSLLQHYDKDLQVAINVAKDKEIGREKVRQQIDQLQQNLLTLEAKINGEYQFYERMMFIVLSVFSLIIVTAYLIFIFGGRRILHRVSALEATMSKIAHTNDLSLRADDLNNDEIGNMARSFNAMVAQLQESSTLIKHKVNDIQTMLQNMPQGLLSFDESNRIKPEYSVYLEKILETDQIAGEDLIDVVFADSSVGSDSIAQISAVAGACVGEDVMNFEFNQHLLLNEIEKEMPNGSKKVLDLNWAPVVDENDVVAQILLCMRDVTELRKLSVEAEEQKRELEIIGEILGVSQEKFHQFISSAISYIDEIENTIRANPNGSQDAVNAMFRNMHTIKGNARTYGLNNLTNRVHDAETIYDELRKPTPAIAWDQVRLLDELSDLRQFVEHYAKVNEVSLGRKGPGRRGNVEKYLLVDKKQIQEAIKLLDRVSHSNIHDLIAAKNVVHNTLRLLGTEGLESAISPIVDSLPALASTLGKAAPVVSIRNGSLLLKTQSLGVIKDIFTHLIRNCVDHGLEMPEERAASGKPEKGHIEVTMELTDDHLKIAIRDDGRGLALHKVWQKAVNNGMLEENQGLNDDKIAALIFLPGFSTADKLSDISGRGVGMDAVLGFARKEGGEVKIHFLDDNEGAEYRAFETALYLPTHYAVRLDEPKMMTPELALS